MEILENGFSLQTEINCGVGLGNFDGLHRGHMALISTLLNECRIHDLNSVIYTFKKHPEHILRKKLFTPLIMTMEHKTRLLDRIGVKTLYYQEFDEEFSRISAEDFIKEILVKKMHMKLAVVGFNYRFGYMCRGDSEMLRRMGEIYGYKVIIIPPVKIGEELVSSTLIRQYITKGRMENAFYLLGRHFSVPGKVITGRKIGRTIGFPTANLVPEKYLVMPATGVYITRTLYQEKWYNSVTNVGTSPTLKNERAVTLETHMAGFNGELYGKDIEVFFIKKIRNERHFGTREDLINQIKFDIQSANNYFTPMQ